MKNIKNKKVVIVLLVILSAYYYIYYSYYNKAEIEYTFINSENLVEHFEKHGIEMNYLNVNDYLQGANEVINNPKSLHKLEKEDEDHIYYLEETNEIVFVSKDGYIRTFFCPDDGINYFNRQ